MKYFSVNQMCSLRHKTTKYNDNLVTKQKLNSEEGKNVQHPLLYFQPLLSEALSCPIILRFNQCKMNTAHMPISIDATSFKLCHFNLFQVT